MPTWKDTLQAAIEIMRRDPSIANDEARLAKELGFARSASARLYKIMACQDLGMKLVDGKYIIVQ
jgi:hypothetical protein